MAIKHTISQVFRYSLKSTLFFLFFSLFSLCILAQNFTIDNKKAVKQFQKAEQLFNQGDSKTAESTVKKAIAIEANFIEAHTLLAYIYIEQKNFAEARSQFKKAVNINPTAIPQNLFILGEMEMDNGNYEESERAFKAFLQTNPRHNEQIKWVEKQLNNIKFAEAAMAHPQPFEPKNMGPAINSEHPEYFPSFTVDGKTILFTRQLSSQESPIGYNEDFYIAHKNEKGEWERAKNIGQPINTALNEGAPSLSADGNILFFTACELYGDYGGKRTGYGSCDIFITAKGKNNKWSEPQNLGPPINTNHWETQPSFSSDGKTLYFVRGMRDRSGKQNGDIYTSILTDEGWSKPKPLSNVINTPGNEESVFIHPDGKTLYFSSDGHPGMGGLDIFVSKKDQEGNWSTPINLGYPINTHKDENSLIVSPDGRIAYFASDREGGYGDLDLYTFELTKELQAEPVNYFAGRVYDKESKRTLSARFELIDLKNGKTTVQSYSNPDGEFLIALPIGKDYALNVEHDGYLFFSENFSMSANISNEPYHKDVPLSPIKVGEKIILKNIFFETAKYALKDESKVELNKVVHFLKKNTSVKIEVSGHTDSVGGDKDNQILSQNRANSVVEYLKSKGIEPHRIIAEGYGKTMPIADNNTSEGRAQNRRTEFKILEL